MSRHVLLIFEGEKTELNYYQSLKRAFFDQDETAVCVCVFGNDVYELSEELLEDPDLDVVELLRESKTQPKNQEALAGISRHKFTEIYLFFDLEYNDDKFSFETLETFINLYSDETDLGYAFINYPMVEATRHVKTPESFLSSQIGVSSCRGKIYKRLSAEEGTKELSDARKITHSDWIQLACINHKKACLITNEEHETLTSQLSILLSQKTKVRTSEIIFILAGLPLFLVHHFGLSLINSLSTE